MPFFIYGDISKKKASTIEKEALFNILNEYMEGKNNQNAVIE